MTAYYQSPFTPANKNYLYVASDEDDSSDDETSKKSKRNKGKINNKKNHSKFIRTKGLRGCSTVTYSEVLHLLNIEQICSLDLNEFTKHRLR